MESQTMKHSHSILAQLVLPMQANPAGNVHGGEIMKMMDSAAGVAAQKHAHTNVVTARAGSCLMPRVHLPSHWRA